MTAASLRQVVRGISAVLPAGAVVKVGIEAAGQYHRLLLSAGTWPVEWELLELNPGHVAEQRKVLGQQAHNQGRRDRSAGDDRAAAGRPRHAGPRPQPGADRADRLVRPPQQSGGAADGHEEPAAGQARRHLPRPDPGAVRRAGHKVCRLAACLVPRVSTPTAARSRYSAAERASTSHSTHGTVWCRHRGGGSGPSRLRQRGVCRLRAWPLPPVELVDAERDHQGRR
jgi:hypothetical protein